MQPEEPKWDQPLIEPRALVGCALMLALALAGGFVYWLKFERWASAPDTSPARDANAAFSSEPTATPRVFGESKRDVQRMKELFDRSMAATPEPYREIFRPGGPVEPPVVVSRVQPVYTETARRARIQGTVIVEAVIDRDGRVTETKVLKGLPMGLDKAAVDAIRQWKFRPATSRGEPVDCYVTLTVQFRVQ